MAGFSSEGLDPNQALSHLNRTVERASQELSRREAAQALALIQAASRLIVADLLEEYSL